MTDENTLMFQVQAGQLDKLAVLFENNKVALYNYFLRTGNSRSVSDDLVQDTFMKVLAYRSSFNGTSSFRTWLFSIARNAAVDYYRRLKGADSHQDVDDVTIAGEHSLDESVVGEQQQNLFSKALAALPVEQREIIMLSRFQQLKYDEIAGLLDCNLNTLKARMRAAISNLQKNYRQLSGEVNQ